MMRILNVRWNFMVWKCSLKWIISFA